MPVWRTKKQLAVLIELPMVAAAWQLVHPATRHSLVKRGLVAMDFWNAASLTPTGERMLVEFQKRPFRLPRKWWIEEHNPVDPPGPTPLGKYAQEPKDVPF